MSATVEDGKKTIPLVVTEWRPLTPIVVTPASEIDNPLVGGLTSDAKPVPAAGSFCRHLRRLVVSDESQFVLCCLNRPVGAMRYLIFSFVYLVIASGFAVLAEVIPCVSWASPGFAAFYRQPRWSPGGLLFFLAVIALSWLINTLGVHGPGIGYFVAQWRHKLLVTVLYFGVLYSVGVIFVVNGPCLQPGDASITMLGLTYTDALSDRMQWTFIYRVAAFALPACLASHWNLMDRVPGLGDIVLEISWIRKWRACQWSAVAIGVSVAIAASSYDLYLLWSIDRLLWYMVALVTLAFLFFGFAFCVRHRLRLHFHHYCFAVFAPWFAVQESPFSGVAQAIFLFIGLEGITTWSPGASACISCMHACMHACMRPHFRARGAVGKARLCGYVQAFAACVPRVRPFLSFMSSEDTSQLSTSAHFCTFALLSAAPAGPIFTPV